MPRYRKLLLFTCGLGMIIFSHLLPVAADNPTYTDSIHCTHSDYDGSDNKGTGNAFFIYSPVVDHVYNRTPLPQGLWTETTLSGPSNMTIFNYNITVSYVYWVGDDSHPYKRPEASFFKVWACNQNGAVRIVSGYTDANGVLCYKTTRNNTITGSFVIPAGYGAKVELYTGYWVGGWVLNQFRRGYKCKIDLTYTLDNTPPADFPVIVDPPNWTPNTSPVLTFGTTDGYSGINHYELSIDNGTAQTVTSPYTLPVLSEGVHNLKVTVVDKAGNRRDAAPAFAYIDTTPPEPFSIIVDPSGWTNNVQPVITFEAADSVSGVDHYTLAIDNGDPQTVTSPHQLSVQSNGSHEVKVTAFDKAGNSRFETAPVKIDTTLPEVAITSPVNGGSIEGSETIVVTTNDSISNISKVEFYVDGVLKGTVFESPFQYNLDVNVYPNGSPHAIMTKAYDQAGNFNFDQINVTTYRSIEISGDLSENQEWSGTVTLIGDVTVPNGVTVIVLPGTVIKTQPDTNFGLMIRGILNVTGTVDQKVTFGEENVAQITWKGIRIEGAGNATINCAAITKAKRGVLVNGGTAMIAGCLFKNNEVGLHVYDTIPPGETPRVDVSGSSFLENTKYGIKEDESGRPRVINCLFSGNNMDYYSATEPDLTMDELNQLNNITDEGLKNRRQ